MKRWERWERWDWYASTPKKAPPKRGIKMKKSGATWWGQRWLEALERMSQGYSNRLARGRSYARAGRTHDLVIKNGRVVAKVTGSRSTPYKVSISLVSLTDGEWEKVIATMAQKAQCSAELLAGQMPQDIDAMFHAAGAGLFPVKETDLTTSCSCPDWANPCKHVAATHYVLGEAFDRDPFLLFEMRGRSKDRVLDALRAARAQAGEPPTGAQQLTDAAESPAIPTVALGRMDATHWDRPPESFPALKLSFEIPPVSGGLLQQLGTPPGWSSEASPAEALGPMIRAAAERARAMAMATSEAELEPAVAPTTAVRLTQSAAKSATKASRRRRKAARHQTLPASSKKPATNKLVTSVDKPTRAKAKTKTKTKKKKASTRTSGKARAAR